MGKDKAPPLLRDPVFLALAFFGALQAVWIGRSLWVADLNLHYPFTGGDGYDWIANALALSGEPVRYTGRPPLFPLLLAALHSAGVESLLPAIQAVAIAAVALTVYASLRREPSRLVAATVALCVLGNETMLRWSLDIMAEPIALALFTGACAAFIAAADRARLYLVAGALGGLAILTQPVTGLLLPAAAVTMALRRRADLRRREPWIGAALLVVVGLSWVFVEPLWMGSTGEHGRRALSLIRPHQGGLSYYGNVAVAIAGWPLLLLIALGIGRTVFSRRPAAVGEPPRSPPAGVMLFTGMLGAGLLAFFLGLYDFRAERFLLYPLVPAVWWAASGLAAVPTHLLRVATGVLAIALSAWPAPAFASHPWFDVARFARGGRTFDTIDPRLFPDAPSIVFLERPDGREEGRWRPIYRLGNALHRRVKVAPATLYPRDWWGWSCLGASLEADEYVLAHWSCAGAPTSAVLAWHRALPPPIPQRELTLRAFERAAGVSATGVDSAIFPITEAPAWERARRLDAELDSPDGFLVAYAVRGERNAWVRALPFVARTTSLVVTPRRGPGSRLREVLARAPTLAAWEVDGCRLRRTRERGYDVLEIEACDDLGED